MNKLPKLSLIIPVYNEEKRVKKGLATALNYLKKQAYPWELIIIDDGSTDRTIGVLSATNYELLTTNYRVHILRTHRNFGKGHAIRLGVEAAEGDYIIFSDIDFSVPIESTEKFIAALKNNKVAIGSRRLRNSKVTKKQNKIRESLGQGFTQISNLILGLDHSDFTCGFKGFKKAAAKNLFRRQRINGWAFDSEILFLTKKLKYKVSEIPVSWKNDPFTKVNLAHDIFLSFISLLLIKIRHLKT